MLYEIPDILLPKFCWFKPLKLIADSLLALAEASTGTLKNMLKPLTLEFPTQILPPKWDTICLARKKLQVELYENNGYAF